MFASSPSFAKQRFDFVSLVAVGTVALDSIETPFGDQDDVLGGSATYLTLAARYFCDPVRLVGVVGNDFPDDYMHTLRESGVDLDGPHVEESGETFSWRGRYHYDMNERDTLATDLNVLEGFDPDLPADYRESRVVCLGNLDPSIQQGVLDQVREPDLVVCDTMNFWIEQTPDALRETLSQVDALVINDSEARELSGEPNLIRAASKIRDMGPPVLVIKKGEHGALLFTDECVFVAPAFPLEDVHDPTGAGDAFAGGFAGYLARAERYDDEHFKRAMIYGSAMASFVVERFGPERLLDLADSAIDERVRSFRELSAVPTLSPLGAEVDVGEDGATAVPAGQ
jgi:sugar/nucleoside kinase (ribokinase family)